MEQHLLFNMPACTSNEVNTIQGGGAYLSLVVYESILQHVWSLWTCILGSFAGMNMDCGRHSMQGAIGEHCPITVKAAALCLCRSTTTATAARRQYILHTNTTLTIMVNMCVFSTTLTTAAAIPTCVPIFSVGVGTYIHPPLPTDCWRTLLFHVAFYHNMHFL